MPYAECMGMEYGHTELRHDPVTQAVAALRQRLGDYFRVWEDEALPDGRHRVILLINQTKIMRERRCGFDMELAELARELGLSGRLGKPWEVELTVHPSWRHD